MALSTETGGASIARAKALESIAIIRATEMHLLKLFSDGKLAGTTHTSVGQEICAAALHPLLDPDRDAFFSTHRCHGHFLAYTDSVEGLLAEVLGREGGVCNGRGGSQHLCSGRFFSNGIVGGGVPIATGYAYRTKLEGKGGIVVAQIGDGALGQGVVYEALNLAAITSAPLLLLVEYNGYAQSTDTSLTTMGDPETRVTGFGVECDRRPANDPEKLYTHLQEVVERVRGGRPFVQILDTFRLMAHSKGDDNRAPELLAEAWDKDYFAKLLANGDKQATAIWEEAQEEVERISAELLEKPVVGLSGATAYGALTEPIFANSRELLAKDGSRRINEQLSQALAHAMAEDFSVFVLGEDIVDPYGGAFKVTKGLSSRWPDRVFSTPISEAGIVGFANGFALHGGRPVVEIMFGDFVTLAMDQLINHASKFNYMYANQVEMALTVRLVSGGYRGYGATHSQSMETYFCKTPGLKVVALSQRHDPESFLSKVVLQEHSPTIFVENKLLYSKMPVLEPPVGFAFVETEPESSQTYPPLQYRTSPTRADLTVVCYGGLTSIAEEAMHDLIIEDEIDIDYLVLTMLHPLQVGEIAESVKRSKRLLTIEEGPSGFGLGAEIVASVAAQCEGAAWKSRRVGAVEIPIPSSPQQEREALPSVEAILAAARSML